MNTATSYNPTARKAVLLRAQTTAEYTTQEVLLAEIALALTDIAESLREATK